MRRGWMTLGLVAVTAVWSEAGLSETDESLNNKAEASARASEIGEKARLAALPAGRIASFSLPQGLSPEDAAKKRAVFLSTLFTQFLNEELYDTDATREREAILGFMKETRDVINSLPDQPSYTKERIANFFNRVLVAALTYKRSVPWAFDRADFFNGHSDEEVASLFALVQPAQALDTLLLNLNATELVPVYDDGLSQSAGQALVYLVVKRAREIEAATWNGEKVSITPIDERVTNLIKNFERSEQVAALVQAVRLVNIYSPNSVSTRFDQLIQPIQSLTNAEDLSAFVQVVQSELRVLEDRAALARALSIEAEQRKQFARAQNQYSAINRPQP